MDTLSHMLHCVLIPCFRAKLTADMLTCSLDTLQRTLADALQAFPFHLFAPLAIPSHQTSMTSNPNTPHPTEPPTAILKTMGASTSQPTWTQGMRSKAYTHAASLVAIIVDRKLETSPTLCRS